MKLQFNANQEYQKKAVISEATLLEQTQKTQKTQKEFHSDRNPETIDTD